MKVSDLVISGGKPKINRNIIVGQYNLPAWEEFREMMEGIFKRRYYTNHGPLIKLLEEKLQEYLGVKHAICITNANIGMMIAAKALDINGKVIVPAFSHISLSQSVLWASLSPIFCDIDIHTHHIDAKKIQKLIDKSVSGILGVNLWGGSCELEVLEYLAKKNNLKLFFYSADAFGMTYKSKRFGNFGDMEVFSFHETELLNSAQGGCVTTNDDSLAARVRNIRSSYGSGPTVPIPYTGNGRMSEAQAGMALLSFKNLNRIKKDNESRYNKYKNEISKIQGISLYQPSSSISDHNFQKVLITVDEELTGIQAHEIVNILNMENIGATLPLNFGFNPNPPFGILDMENTVKLCREVIELPNGSKVRDADILLICEILECISKNGKKLSNNIYKNN